MKGPKGNAIIGQNGQLIQNGYAGSDLPDFSNCNSKDMSNAMR